MIHFMKLWRKRPESKHSIVPDMWLVTGIECSSIVYTFWPSFCILLSKLHTLLSKGAGSFADPDVLCSGPDLGFKKFCPVPKSIGTKMASVDWAQKMFLKTRFRIYL
jgi:hypothetical protein